MKASNALWQERLAGKLPNFQARGRDHLVFLEMVETIHVDREKFVTELRLTRSLCRNSTAQQKKQEKMSSWVNGVRDDFKGKTTYQVGYAPPPDTNATTTR